jgi:DNA-binding NtrC family response regulator
MWMTKQAIRVLIVDDEPFVRDSLAEYLADFDFSVSSAGSAEEMLTLLEEAPQDVAIVDLRLPGMSGDALIQRAHEIAPAMRFLIHTGSVDYRISGDLMKIGVRQEHVILKPQPSLDNVVKVINDLVEE